MKYVLHSIPFWLFIMLKVTSTLATWSWWWLLLPQVPSLYFILHRLGAV